jgi:hypothetical protein
LLAGELNVEAGELDALIASNIGDLEAALARVHAKIDPELNAEAWNTLKLVLHHAEYHFKDGKDPDEAWFAAKSWLDEDGDSDPWFRLTARDASALKTWLACYVAPGSECEAMGISGIIATYMSVITEPYSTPTWKNSTRLSRAAFAATEIISICLFRSTRPSLLKVSKRVTSPRH